jgi:hypothetical protein
MHKYDDYKSCAVRRGVRVVVQVVDRRPRQEQVHAARGQRDRLYAAVVEDRKVPA